MSDIDTDADRQHDLTNASYHTAAEPAEGGSVSRAVIEAVAELEGTDPTELPVLADVVDPDALDRLFGPRFDGGRREVDGRVEFDYGGYRVTVEADGSCTVRSVATDGE